MTKSSILNFYSFIQMPTPLRNYFILFTQRLQLDLETVFLIIRLDKFESCRRIFFSLNCLILFTELNRGRKRVRDVCYKRWNLSKFWKEGGSCFCYWLLVLRVSLQLIYAHGFLQLNSNQPYTGHIWKLVQDALRNFRFWSWFFPVR